MTQQKQLFQARFFGNRFKEGHIPLDFLINLTEMGNVITEFAKWRFQQACVESSEKNNENDFSNYHIALGNLKTGSVVVTFILVSDKLHCDLFETLISIPQCFNMAKDDFIETIKFANVQERDGKALIEILPVPLYLLWRVSDIGKRLRKSESIEFTSSEDSGSVFLTKETAVSLRQIYKRIIQYIKFINSFSSHFTDPEKIKNILGDATPYDDVDSLKEWEYIIKYLPPDPLDVSACLKAFEKLKDGWIDGDGIAPGRRGLTWLRKIFNRNYSSELPAPYTCSTFDGKIRMEWEFKEHEIDFLIDLKTHKGEWVCYQSLEDDPEYAREVVLDHPKDWKWIEQEIRSFEKVGS